MLLRLNAIHSDGEVGWLCQLDNLFHWNSSVSEALKKVIPTYPPTMMGNNRFLKGKLDEFSFHNLFSIFNPLGDERGRQLLQTHRWSGYVLAPHRRAQEWMESVGWKMELATTGANNLSSLEKLGAGYPRKQKAQAEFPNMRGDDFRSLWLHRESYRGVWRLRDFCEFRRVIWEFLVPVPSIQFSSYFCCAFDQSMMLVMVVSPRLMVMCGIQLDVFISISLPGCQGKH